MHADFTPPSVDGGRKRLLSAAHELFPVEGFAGCSVAKILANSKLQAPSLYHHFGDKEGLYMAWLDESLSDLGHRIQVATQGSAPFETKLAAVSAVMMDSRSPDILLIRRDARSLKSDLNSQKLHSKLMESVVEPLMNLFLSESNADPRTIERTVDAFLLGASGLGRSYSMRTPNDPGETAQWWARLFLKGVGNRVAQVSSAVAILFGAVS